MAGDNGFLFAADLHCRDRGMRDYLPADCYNALNQIVTIGNDLELPIVLGGDIFDTNRQRGTPVVKVRQRLERARFGKYGILGNHDKDEDSSWLRAIDIEPLTLTPTLVGGIPLAGIDYCPATVFHEKLDELPECSDLNLVIHQALRQALGFEGAWNADLDWIPHQMCRNVWAGDIHAEGEHWSKNHKVRGVYPGTTVMGEVTDNPFPTVIHVHPEVDELGFHRYSRIPLKHRPFVNLSFETTAQMEQFIEGDDVGVIVPSYYDDLPEELQAPIVFLQYRVNMPGILAAISALCQGTGAHLIAEALPAAGGVLDASPIAFNAERMTLAEALASRLPKKSQQRERDLALDLAGCTSVEGITSVIASHREKIFSEVAKAG